MNPNEAVYPRRGNPLLPEGVDLLTGENLAGDVTLPPLGVVIQEVTAQ